MSWFEALALYFLLLFLQGFFSGTELVLVSTDKAKLRAAQQSGSRAASIALRLIASPDRFFSTTLLGTNICSVMSTVVLTFFLTTRYGEQGEKIALLFAPLNLIIGEVVPKSVYQYYASKIVFYVAPLLSTLTYLLFPIVWPLSQLTRFILKQFREQAAREPVLSRQDLEIMIEQGDAKYTDVKPVERNLLSRIFDLAEKHVSNIMTPLVDVVALPLHATRKEAIELFEEQAYSRVPVYDEHIYNMVGILWNTDLLFDGEDKSVSDLMRKPYYVPQDMPLDELLVSMKRRGQPMALVVDEYGAVTGIVTVEDLLEEVVGEIRDEHDEVKPLYQRLGPKRFLINGRLEVEQANERLKLGIPDGDYETVAGFVLTLATHIPQAGEVFSYKHLQFIVRMANERMIQEIEVLVRSPKGSDEPL